MSGARKLSGPRTEGAAPTQTGDGAVIHPHVLEKRMHSKKYFSLALAAALLGTASLAFGQTVTSPKAHFGFDLGADGKYAPGSRRSPTSRRWTPSRTESRPA